MDAPYYGDGSVYSLRYEYTTSVGEEEASIRCTHAASPDCRDTAYWVPLSATPSSAYVTC